MPFSLHSLRDLVQQQLTSSLSSANSTGVVVEVQDGLASLTGLAHCRLGEVLRFPSGDTGLALQLEATHVTAGLLGSGRRIKAGEVARCTGELLHIPVGPELLGRVVDPLGRPLDGRGSICASARRQVESPGLGLLQRQPFTRRYFHTGIKILDATYGGWYGASYAIVGDRATGKTTLALDIILAQQTTKIPCVYVAIGQDSSAVVRATDLLKKHDALRHTCIVHAPAGSPALLRYLAPFAGCAVAEQFVQQQGDDVLIVFDDLNGLAVAWREVWTLLRRPPGHGFYPADLQHLLARLFARVGTRVERWAIIPPGTAPESVREQDAVNGRVYVGLLEKEEAERRDLPHYPNHQLARIAGAGGSLTALAIIETQEEDITATLPRAALSQVERQWHLEKRLWDEGIRPALGHGGWQVPGPPYWKLYLKGIHELQQFVNLGVELDRATRKYLERGYRLLELLKQLPHQPLTSGEQIVILHGGMRGHFDHVPLPQVPGLEQDLLAWLRQTQPPLLNELTYRVRLTEKVEQTLTALLEAWAQQRQV